jgi:hypothetical protein
MENLVLLESTRLHHHLLNRWQLFGFPSHTLQLFISNNIHIVDDNSIDFFHFTPLFTSKSYDDEFEYCWIALDLLRPSYSISRPNEVFRSLYIHPPPHKTSIYFHIIGLFSFNIGRMSTRSGAIDS